MEQEILALQQIIDSSKRIVFFGGAGVSTESGVQDFRSVDGLYHEKWSYPPETMLSHSFFVKKTPEFFRFYRAKLLGQGIFPNAAHKKLAEMEAAGKLSAVITQNIDGLHQAAGSKRVFELHGSVLRNYCTECGQFYDDSYVRNWIDKAAAKAGLDMQKAGAADYAGQWPKDSVPLCERHNCTGIVKPDVVLYEEGLDDNVVTGAISAIRNADCLIIGGTSLVVYPAASFIRYFSGPNLVLINKSETPVDSMAQLVIHDSIGKVLDQIKV